MSAQPKWSTLGSLSENVTWASGLVVGLAGGVTITAAGAVVSTTQVTLDDEELPAASVAVTTSVCEPSASPLVANVLRVVQGPAVAASSAQVSVAEASDSAIEMLTAVELVGVAGWESTGGGGACVSTVQVSVTVTAFFVPDFTLSRKLCLPSVSVPEAGYVTGDAHVA